jgi:hypothetical protein
MLHAKFVLSIQCTRKRSLFIFLKLFLLGLYYYYFFYYHPGNLDDRFFRLLPCLIFIFKWHRLSKLERNQYNLAAIPKVSPVIVGLAQDFVDLSPGQWGELKASPKTCSWWLESQTEAVPEYSNSSALLLLTNVIQALRFIRFNSIFMSSRFICL